MAPLIKILLLASSVMIILTLAGTAMYYTVQINVLSLPISQIYAYSALALPIATALTTLVANRVRSKLSNLKAPQNTLLLLAIIIAQTFYETVIATLAATYMFPGCSVEEKWKALYIRKDGDAIRRIQDRFACCGFNSAVDRAWPFPRGRPGDGFGADQCKRMFGREMACREAWSGAQRSGAGVFLGLAGSIFVFKALTIFFHIYRTSTSQSPGWMRYLGRLGSGEIHHESFDHLDGNRGLIDQGESVVEQERYLDEAADGDPRRAVNSNSSDRNRPRVEPSGLATNSNGADWNDDM